MSLKKVKIEQTPQSVQHKIKQLDEEHNERMQIFQRDDRNFRQSHHEYKIPYDPPNFRQYVLYHKLQSDYSQQMNYYDFSLINSKFDISLDIFNSQIQRLQISEETVGLHKSDRKNYILEIDQGQSNQKLPPRGKDSLDTQYAQISIRKSQTHDLNMETKQREQSNYQSILGDNYIEQIHFQGNYENNLNRSTYDLDRDLSQILLDQFKKQIIIPCPQRMLQQQYLQQYEEIELISDEEVQIEYVDRANKEEIVQQFLHKKSSFQKQQSSQNSNQSQSIQNPIIEVKNLMLSNSSKQSDQKLIHSHNSISSQKQIGQEIFRPAQSEQGRQQQQLQQQQNQVQISNFQSNMKQSVQQNVSNLSEKSMFNDLIFPPSTHSKSMIQQQFASEINYQRVSSSEKQIGISTQSIRQSPLTIDQIQQQQFQKAAFPNLPFSEQLKQLKKQSESHLKIQQTPKNQEKLIITGEFPTIPFTQQLEEFKRQQSNQQTPRQLHNDSIQSISQRSSQSKQNSAIQNFPQPTYLEQQIQLNKINASISSSSQNSLQRSQKSVQSNQNSEFKLNQSRMSGRQSGQFVTLGDKEIYEIEQKLRQNCKFSFENLSIVDFQLDQNHPLVIRNQKSYLQLIIDAKIAHDKVQNQIKESLLGQELIDKVKKQTNERIFKQKKLTNAQKKLLSHSIGKVEEIGKLPEQVQNSDSSIISIIQHIPSSQSFNNDRQPTKSDQKMVAALEEIMRRPGSVQAFAGKKKPTKRKAAAKKKVKSAPKLPFHQKFTKNKKTSEPEYIVESSGHIQSFIQESSYVVERTHPSNDQSLQSLGSMRSLKQIRPFSEIHNEESPEESQFAQRAPPVREIPRFIPQWNKGRKRNEARKANDFFLTEDWRKVTDIMPNFYPSANEAGNYKLKVLEGLRDFRFYLQFTLYSGQVIGPVGCKKRMTLVLGKKPEPHQTEEMIQGLSLHSNLPLNRGFCERQEAYIVEKKFILANGTRMDIIFQIAYDPAEQKKKGQKRKLK